MALTRNRLIGNLANATDSAASSSFLAKGATEADYQSIAYSDVTGKPTILDSAGITSLMDSSYVQARQGSAVAGLDSAGITSLVDSNYVVARAAASGSGYGRYNYTATAGQTVFQDSDNSGALLSYTSGGIMVFYNGVMLKNTSDWEGTDGSSVTLVEAADSGANVSIHKWTVVAGIGTAALYGDRGIVAGGNNGSNRLNNIDYWDMTTSNNASDFGDLNIQIQQCTGTSDAIRGLFASGYDGADRPNFIDYITIASPGNATDFGDLSTATAMATAAVSDATYGVFGGRYTTIDYGVVTIDYVTIQTTGDASDFGDLTLARFRACPVSNSTYGLFAGAGGSSDKTIDYVTIATPGNASDFGDLIQAMEFCPCTSNGTVVQICGGNPSSGAVNTIQQITVQTTGNASDFADLTDIKGQSGSTSGNAA